MIDPGLQLLAGAALPLLAALGMMTFGGKLGRLAGWPLLGASIASVALLADLAIRFPSAVVFQADWMPALGVGFHLRGDRFGLFFALLIATIGVLVTTYSLRYLRFAPAHVQRRYFSALATFMGAMIGVALSDDLILLFVCWELTSLSSFVLIGHNFDIEEARTGAVRALLVTALGGLVMSVGFLLTGAAAGTFSISTIASSPQLVERVLSSPLAPAALLCIFCGAFTKSAQFPFHFWLPRAMVAPTPVSAYLHAATMVKAGIFLLGRMEPVFGAAELWAPVLVGVGATTMTLGAWQSARETDLKGILARSTGSTLGLIVMLYGLGAADQDALQMMSHALYKGALFLLVGIVEHRAHTRDLRQLGGLRSELPLAFVAFAVAALSMAGLPPLFGFLAKESMFAAVLAPAPAGLAGWAGPLVVAASVASSALLAAAAWRMTAGIFLGTMPAALERRLANDLEHDAEPMLVGPPLLLAGGAVALGLAAVTPLTSVLVSALSSQPDADLHLTPLPHLGAPLLLTVAALTLAALLHTMRASIGALADRLRLLPPAETIWDRGISAVIDLGSAYSRRWENGSLRWYLGATLATLPLFTVYVLDEVGLSYRDIRVSLADLPWQGLLCCAMLGVTTVTAVLAKTRLAAAITTTMVGFFVAMMFVVYRSPDILLTQILIETVSTIFLLLVIVHLPPFRLPDLTAGSRVLHGAVSAAVGLCVTGLLLLAMTPGLREPDNIATRPDGLLARSLTDGGGANAVNVIIVDLRALDTTGEVTVVVVVGLCIYGLLRTRRTTA